VRHVRQVRRQQLGSGVPKGEGLGGLEP